MGNESAEYKKGWEQFKNDPTSLMDLSCYCHEKNRDELATDHANGWFEAREDSIKKGEVNGG